MVRHVLVAAASKLRLAACCAAALLVHPSLVTAAGNCGDDAPLVTHGSIARSALSEAEVLAQRVLKSADTTPEGVPDLPRGGADLAAELAHVLSAVRASSPDMAEVTARSPWEPGTLILRLEPALFQALSRILAAPGAEAALCTGDAEFDALNASFGLRAVQSFSFMSAVLAHFDPHLDVLLASLAYESLDGVSSAEPNFFVGDGSNIGARWVVGTWHLVFRRAWGDCPSGCLYSELHLFTERKGAVERVGAERSARWAPFARILLERQWDHRPEAQ